MLTKTTHPVNGEIQVIIRTPLSVQQSSLPVLMGITPRSVLQAHHLLQNRVLILIQEIGQLAGVNGSVKLQERSHGQNGELGGDIGNEDVDLAGQGVNRGLSNPKLELLVVLVRWGDGREEFGSGTNE